MTVWLFVVQFGLQNKKIPCNLAFDQKSQVKYSFFITTLLLILWDSDVEAQIGGLQTFDFLNLVSTARSTALASYPIAAEDDDIGQGYINPALINDKTRNHLSINHNFHFADISHGFAAFGFQVEQWKTDVMIGLNYVSYGQFTRADFFGNNTGEFSGSSAALTLGFSRQLDERLRAGLNVKYANSSLDTYSASGLGFDFGFHYRNEDSLTDWALVFKNIGGQLSGFNDDTEAFPMEIQLGFAKRLKHLPFQFMITAVQLQRWDLRNPLDDNSNTLFIDQPSNEPSSFSKGIDNFFRHLTFGGELFIGANEVVRLRLGYNHLRNKELSVSGFRSLSGFSFGFGIRVKKLRFDYGVGRYHLGGAVNHLSLSIDLDSFFDKL